LGRTKTGLLGSILVKSDENNTLSRQVADYALMLGKGDLSALGKLFDLTAPRLLRYAKALTAIEKMRKTLCKQQ